MELVEFLRARIIETEEFTKVARLTAKTRERMLREVQARRRIIDACVETLAGEDKWDPQLDGGSGEEFELARYTLRMLAWPDADHPDYDESWKP